MTPSELESALEAALQAAFQECETSGFALTSPQKQILLQALSRSIRQTESCAIVPPASDNPNPLDDLTPEQRRLLLHFIEAQNQQNYSWKAQLLNDWLHSRDSGEMQFIRQRYGIQWLEKIRPLHIAQYADEIAMTLRVGDRIEVSNRLWEWVQPHDPSSQDWYACTVVGISETEDPTSDLTPYTSCAIRFDNGMEYEVQGIYEWNRYSWRWLKGG